MALWKCKYKLPVNNFTFLNILPAGGFAEIWMCLKRDTSEIVVVKAIDVKSEATKEVLYFLFIILFAYKLDRLCLFCLCCSYKQIFAHLILCIEIISTSSLLYNYTSV